MILPITHYLWGQTGVFPGAVCELEATPDHLRVRFRVTEPELRAIHTRHNANVYEDSCVELFCCPYADDKRYFNIEINPLGAALFAIGESRASRVNQPNALIDRLEITSSIRLIDNRFHWETSLTVPYTLIGELYKRPPAGLGDRIRLNVYKCGDLTTHPHWGSWQPIGTELPDFHRPEFFGEVVLKEG